MQSKKKAVANGKAVVKISRRQCAQELGHCNTPCMAVRSRGLDKLQAYLYRL